MHRPQYLLRQKGFTLIELMMTLVILGVLGGLAAPNFSSYLRNAQLTSTTNSFVATVNAARTEGMKRNLHAYVTPSDGLADWTVGWRAFVDVDFSGDFSTGDIVVSEHGAPSDYIDIEGNGTGGQAASYILYDGSGFSKDQSGGFGASTLTFQRTDSNELRNVRRIKIAATGRIRVCTPKTATDSACGSTTSSE